VKKSHICNVAQPFFVKINFITITAAKSSPKICDTSVNFKILPKVTNRPIGENSPNLVALIGNPDTDEILN
jgi:hypothetical protein